MSCKILLGVMLILLGAGIIIKIVFNLDIPVFKILVGLFIVYIGLVMITGKRFLSCHHYHNTENVIFNERDLDSTDVLENQEKNVIFGSSLIDLTNINLGDSTIKTNRYIKINTVFGNAKIRIRRDTPVRITVESAFAGAQLPDGRETAFGTHYYTSPNLSSSEKHVEIYISVVFGKLIVELVN